MSSLELECSDASYNWCYIEKQINAANDEKIYVKNAAVYSNAERLEASARGNITEIPVEFFINFPKLKYIRVSTGGNGINTINPEHFAYASHLKTLNLMSNNIRVVPRYAFKAMPLLVQINLKFNSIDDLEEHAFDGLNNLQKLFLSYNRIDRLRRNSFVGATRLIELMLDNNHISVIDDGTFDLPALNVLSLNNNRLSSLSNQLFIGMPLLQNIDLSASSITQLPETFFNMPQLNYINLSHNNLSTQNIFEFGAMDKLRVLILANTFIQRNVEAIQQINVNHNSVQIDSGIEILDLSHNRIRDADILSQLSVFEHLQVLILDDNELNALIDVADAIERMPFLREIRLRGNEISAAVKNAFATKQHVVL